MLRQSLRSAAFALLAAASVLVLPSAAFAKGGSGGGGGGGTTPAPGVIKVAGSAVADCDNGTNLSLSLSKARSGQTQEVLVMSGNTGGFWMFKTIEVTSGRSVVSFGGNRSELGTASSITTVVVNSWLPKGTWDLAFTGTRTELVPGGPIDASGTLLETCTAHMTVVVG